MPRIVACFFFLIVYLAQAQNIWSLPEDTNLALIMQVLQPPRIINEHHAQRLMMPASTLKLITSLVALRDLVFNFRFVTRLFIDVRQKLGSQLRGPVYLQFSGDPSLTSDHLQQLFTDLKQQGVDHLQGDVILDESVFAKPSLGPGWMWDDASECFSVQVAAANIDHACAKAKVIHSGQSGTMAKLTMTSPGIWEHKVAVVPMIYRDDKVTIKQVAIGHYVVRGHVRVQTSSLGVSLAVKQHKTYVKWALVRAIRQSGLLWNGRVRWGRVPRQVRVVSEHQSQPLWRLVQDLLQYSDNLYADALFKRLGAIGNAAPATWRSGAQAVVKSIKSVTRDSMIRIVDGSGLSRYNQVTARTLMASLKYYYFHMPEGLSLLPTMYVLEPWWWQSFLTQKLNLHAKTGSMTGVAALAGIRVDDPQQPLVFAMIINGFADPLRYYRHWLLNMTSVYQVPSVVMGSKLQI